MKDIHCHPEDAMQLFCSAAQNIVYGAAFLKSTQDEMTYRGKVLSIDIPGNNVTENITSHACLIFSDAMARQFLGNSTCKCQGKINLSVVLNHRVQDAYT